MQAIALHSSQFGRHLHFSNGDVSTLGVASSKIRLDWSVSVSGDLEIDIYDALSPTYLLVVSR